MRQLRCTGSLATEDRYTNVVRELLRVGVAAGVLLLGATACQSGGDVEALDQRVVNGVVQRPGGSGYEDQQWMRQKLQQMILPDVESCLTDQGRADIVPEAGDLLGGFLAMHSSDLPSPQRYRMEGVNPEGTLDGLTEQENEAQQVVIECYTAIMEDEGERSPAALAGSIESAWTGELGAYFNDHPLPEDFDEFETCLAEKTGYPPQGIEAGVMPDVYGFLYWWPAQHGGDEVMSAEDNLEGGRIYADCLDLYTDARAEATDEMREQFIQDHYQDLKMVNDALTQ